MSPLSIAAACLASLGAIYLGPCWFHPAVIQSFGTSARVRRASAAASFTLTTVLVACVWWVAR